MQANSILRPRFYFKTSYEILSLDLLVGDHNHFRFQTLGANLALNKPSN